MFLDSHANIALRPNTEHMVSFNGDYSKIEEAETKQGLYHLKGTFENFKKLVLNKDIFNGDDKLEELLGKSSHSSMDGYTFHIKTNEKGVSQSYTAFSNNSFIQSKEQKLEEVGR